MSTLTGKQDGFGKGIWDYHRGRADIELGERDDGLIIATGGPAAYFREYADWPSIEKQAIKLAHGRVLDVGCGGGRVGLHLQNKGLDVVGIDNSPLAVKTCRQRGLKSVTLKALTQTTRDMGLFDTIILYGNNLGLAGTPTRTRWLLRRWRSLTRPDAVILASERDPYKTDLPEHLAYHRHNRRRGRMGGQIRLRIRYRDYATPWWDLLLLSVDEMRQIVSGTGWQISRIFESDGPSYIAALTKEAQP
jgi:SAM-dependent methyltransferase